MKYRLGISVCLGISLVAVSLLFAAEGEQEKVKGLDHWAFKKPVKPALPSVKNSAWVKSPLDHFVLAELEKVGLKPEAEADRYTLIRRLYLDLIGLPPTLAEADAFANDKSPNAYEKVVDRLLQHKAYGERWARLWLDLARFADTKGYEKDLRRPGLWRYRDWVIDAFNADVPYDRFTTEQLAGDMLPGATPEQVLATAFHRTTMSNDEGGTDDEEFRTVAVKDRVDTTMQVWMGLTMGCAKCHTHKYDPVTLREYYQFYAFLNQTEDADRFDDQPLMAIPGRAIEEYNAKVNAEVARLNERLLAPDPALDAAQAEWEKKILSDSQWIPLEPAEVRGEDKEKPAKFTTRTDNSVLVSGEIAARDTYHVVARTELKGVTGFRLEALTDFTLPQTGPGRTASDPNFVVNDFAVKAVSVADSAQSVEVRLHSAKADYSQPNWDVAGAIDDKPETGWAIAGQTSRDHAAVFRTKEPVGFDGGTEFHVKITQHFGGGLLLGKFRVSVTTAAEPKLDAVPQAIVALLKIPVENRAEEQKKRVTAHFRSTAPRLAELRVQIETEKKKLLTPPQVPVMRELPAGKRRVTKTHIRGSFLDQGSVVEPGVPAALGSWPPNAPANRLGLAQWLVNRDNPLTARVAVNRWWAQFFGAGIVETEEDFGTQGTPPSHPLLLDYLAVEFMDSPGANWSFKKLCKTIVMSATYRQGSRATQDKIAKDPRNRLISRGPRFRMEAEMVRDNTLAASGLLSEKMYGPSVMPWQPTGLWAAVYSGDDWKTSPGEDRYRRGVYTFIRRTTPYPSMVAFDGPSREICTVRRIRTNTPLQALVTLNDPVYVEAAQAMARKVVREGGATPRDRAAYALRLALIRPAKEMEIGPLLGLYERRLEQFRADPSSALPFATDPLGPLPDGSDAAELAAWTAVCNVVLNLDESQTKN